MGGESSSKTNLLIRREKNSLHFAQGGNWVFDGAGLKGSGKGSRIRKVTPITKRKVPAGGKKGLLAWRRVHPAVGK